MQLPRLSLALLAVLIAASQAAFAGSSRTVILLSVDGLAADDLELDEAANLRTLKKEGVFARLIPPFPSLTFPSHATMATGCSPAKHGIVANRFIDKQRGEFEFLNDPTWLECEPLWVTAERQKVRTSVSHWCFSYGPWNGVEPSIHPTSYREKKSDRHTLNNILEQLKSDPKSRPRLVMAYLNGADHAGHEAGPGSPEMKKALKRTDQLIRKFVDGLKGVEGLKPYTVVIVSDHGMAKVSEVIDLGKILTDQKIPGVPVAGAPGFFLYLWDPTQAASLAKKLNGLDGIKAFSATELPKELGPASPRMGDIIGFVDPPKMLVMRSWNKQEGTPKGMHGYRSDLPAMHGVFLAFGDGIAAAKEMGQRPNIDVAATVAKLLEIDPPKQNEGKAIQEALLETP